MVMALYLLESMVKDSLAFIQIDVDLLNVVAVLLLNSDVYVLTVYRPSSSLIQDENLVSFISDFCVGREVLILGDFDLPSLDWMVKNVIGSYAPPREMFFFDSFSLLGLSQRVKEGTFIDSNNILDLVLTTEWDRIGDVLVLEPFPRCHHCPVVCEYVLQFTGDNEDEVVEKRLWSKGNYAELSNSILAVDWLFEFDGRSVNNCFLYLVGVLQALVDKYVPISNQIHVPVWLKGPPRWLCKREGC